MSGQIITREKNYATLQAMLRGDPAKKAIAALLRSEVDADRFLRLALGCLQRTPELQKCTPVSLMLALSQAASLRLEPDGLTNRAHIVPFGDTATFILGYKGVVELILRPSKKNNPPSPHSWVDLNCAIPVFSGDTFEYEYGLTPALKHVPLCPADERVWANLTHVYVVWERADGHRKFDVMTRPEIETSRNRSRSKTGPWSTDPIPMALKTCILRGKRTFELDPDTERALEVDTRLDAGERVEIGDLLGVDAESIAADAAAALAGREARKAGGSAKLAAVVEKANAEKQIPTASVTTPAAAANGATHEPAPAEPEPQREPGDDTPQRVARADAPAAGAKKALF
jgi:recombination protein RecT